MEFDINFMTENVAILGASPKARRYSYRAQQALLENGHTPIPVNPRYQFIDSLQCFPDLKSVTVGIDTITVYVRPDILYSMATDIIELHPGRVIFNPGSECQEVADRIASANIRVQYACTLVLLNTSAF
jgi:predicted CoA-binding protein